MIFVIFNDDVDLYFARTRVLERLNLVTKELPAGVVPTLGPDATGVGHVFWYTVEGGGKSLRDLRSLQDWYVQYSWDQRQTISSSSCSFSWRRRLSPRNMPFPLDASG
jgi:Cu(I)/Ag(I) efflux system membrane protein CusA/SilA